MARCQIKKGFLILRDCGAETRSICSICGRPMCERHATGRGSNVQICLDCYGRMADNSKLDPNKSSGARWRHAYRHDFYASGRYAPILQARFYDEYYSDYDVRAFDVMATDRSPGEGWDDDADADLFDS